MATQHTHAKDFLIEFANESSTHGWLRDLIIRIITTNGNLSEDDLVTTTTQLKNNGIGSLTMPTTASVINNTDIRIIELEHIGGVCALAPHQSIKFSDQITLLYGTNGSGKSSYFKILNEIIGGNRKIEIIPNIYKSLPSPIDINIKYTENGIHKLLHWDGSERAISPLNLSSVFDSEYTKSFLDKRSADTAIVYPYGLHLFTALTTAIDNIKGRIDSEIASMVNSLPNIEVNGLSDAISMILTQHSYRDAQKAYIEARYEMPKEKVDNLILIENQIKSILQTNYDDKIKIAKSEKAIFESLHSFMDTTSSAITNIVNEIKGLYSQIKTARDDNNKAKAKIQILKEIGDTDSEEWKQFVKAGNIYVNKDHLSIEICPYCRQNLSHNALDIISAYRTYIEDKSENTLTVLQNQKKHIYSKTNMLNVSYAISDQLKNLFGGITDTYPHVEQQVTDAINEFSKIKACILESFDNEEFEYEPQMEIIQIAITTISKVIATFNDTITKLSEEKNKKDEQIQVLTEKKKPLVEHKAISEQSSQFKEWFEIMQKVKELQGCMSELSTRNISILAKTASQALISDNLKSKYQEELNALKLGHLKVELSDDRASRGQLQMKIHLVNNNDVRKVLSEGEQKGVALALFIAERRMQLSTTPIILDDPVNSLDHYITASLMERLTQLDNQIVIFSHNVLLQTSLVGLNSVHLCGINQRNSCTKNNKHLYIYKVISQGQDMKGIITEWRQDNAANNLRKANSKLSEVPFTDTETVSTCLRKAIEMLIDEKIFNNLIPLKLRGRKDSIHWEELKKLNADTNMIDDLKAIHNRLSGGELHSGMEHEENSLEFDELKSMYDKLIKMIQ